MIKRDTGSIDQVMVALRELEETVAGAQRFLGDRCVVTRTFVSQRLELIGRCLPDAVTQAAAIVKEEQNILEAARKTAAEMESQASRKAQESIDSAARKADEMRTEATNGAAEAKKANDAAKAAADAMKAQAESDASAIRQQAQKERDAIIAKAQQDAQIIRANADNAARAAVSQENVYRMATVAAEELREKTAADMSQYRQQCIDYLDSVMAGTDRYLLKLSEDIRYQRQLLDSQR